MYVRLSFLSALRRNSFSTAAAINGNAGATNSPCATGGNPTGPSYLTWREYRNNREKPDIKVEFTGQFEGLLVMLDNTEVTQIVKKTENGFTYKPITNLAAGAHILKVTSKDREGKTIQKEFGFA